MLEPPIRAVGPPERSAAVFATPRNLWDIMTTFADLELDPKVLQAVTDTGYLIPTPIQEQAIPHALHGRDVLGIAQTGTGKTASFVLPMIHMLSKGRARARMPRSLVLCPTRELAAQVSESFEKYAKHVKLTMALLIGGVSLKDQERLIDRGVDVLIATPGRLLDHFERGSLLLQGVQIMVVDEADRMLDMGFIPDIERIFKLTPFTRQTLFFSATMAPEITRITEEFLHNPVRVEVARQATTSATISQFICEHKPARRDTADAEKREILRRLIVAEGESLTNGIIFCNRKRDVDVVAKSLSKHGHDAAAMHGDLDQSVRTRILKSFREGELKLLVASDVAARGLDIPNVSHIFNFDVPTHSEDYVHRIGRTARAGRPGKSITLCLPFEDKYLKAIEELVKLEIPRLPSPLTDFVAGAERAPTRTSEAAERGPRGRSRGGRERGPKPVMPAVPAVETEAKPAPAPRPTPQRPENRPAPKPHAERGSHRVKSFGDHMPAFLMQELVFPSVEPEVTEPAAAPISEPATKPKRVRAPRKAKLPAETTE